MLFFFFFQAEDGIRDRTVTGVQTCALPIFAVIAYRQPVTRAEVEAIRGVNCDQTIYTLTQRRLIEERGRRRSEERRVGKEWRGGWGGGGERARRREGVYALCALPEIETVAK